jgi:hypothetical protein
MIHLLFSLCQNWHGEFSDKEPFQVIEFIDKDHPPRGYSMCDEFGRTDWLPSCMENGICYFLPANEDTELAFIGEKKWIGNKEVCIIKWVPDCAGDIEMLRQEKGYYLDDQKL